jgi:hypothetical protein
MKLDDIPDQVAVVVERSFVEIHADFTLGRSDRSQFPEAVTF